jgi:hypothetical protein
MEDTSVVTASLSGEVDDPLLDALAARASLFAPMGGDEDDEEVDVRLPWQFAVPRPIALDVRTIYAAATTGQSTSTRESGSPGPAEAPPAASTAPVASTPPPVLPGSVILLRHSMTALARPGEKPPPVWGMGYTFRLLGVDDAATVSLVPDTTAETVASATGHVDVGIDARGHLDLGKLLDDAAAGAIIAALPIQIPELQLQASTGAQLSVGFRLDLQALQVQAAPLDAGGAQWNLYRRGRDLTRTQILVHTVAIPDRVETLRVRVETWVRRKTLFGRNSASNQWSPPSAEYEIPVR